MCACMCVCVGGWVGMCAVYGEGEVDQCGVCVACR